MPIGVKGSEYTVFEDGDYEVVFSETTPTGQEIGGWFPVDEQGLPSLVDQKQFGEITLVARFRTVINGDYGPPGSINPEHELLPLVRAFGGDPAGLKEEKNIGRRLLMAQRLMTGSTKLSVKKGWVQLHTVQGMGIPKAGYYLRLSRITSTTPAGELGPMEHKNGPLVVGKMKISRGQYKGTEVTFFMGYPLVIMDVTDDEGNVILDTDGNPEQIPALKQKSDGALNIASVRFKNYLLGFYGPDYGNFPHQKSDDIENLMPLLTKMMLARNLESFGFVTDNRVDLNSFGPVPDGEQEEISFFSGPQNALRRVITDEVVRLKEAGAWVNDDNWDLTSEGKSWAGEFLVGILNEFDLPRIFEEWSGEDIEKVLKALGFTKLGSIMEDQF